MPHTLSPKLPIALGLLILACGCGIESDTIESITEVVNRAGNSGSNGEMSDSSDPFSVANGVMGSANIAESGNDLLSREHSFEPLYPDRDNPFVYPDEVDNNASAPTSTSVAEIQVMGFANVQSNLDGSAKESKVMLKTNVGIKLLAVGEQVGPITVLRIDSPTVELKMGSLIWTATMFDR